MLDMPQQGTATSAARAPDGFHKLKVVAECLDSDGNTRTRRITAAIPVAGGKAVNARAKWEKDGEYPICMSLGILLAAFVARCAYSIYLPAASCVHEIVWSLGPVENTVEDTDVQGSEEMEEQLEDLTEMIDTLKFENQNIQKVAQEHVGALEQEIEALQEQVDELREVVEENEFQRKSMVLAAEEHVGTLEQEIEALTEQLDEEKFSHKQFVQHSTLHVEQLESELASLRPKEAE